ncbi:MAG: transposase [Actinomycetota bacterium]|nr:transposase [Actinomycetota bacterium]
MRGREACRPGSRPLDHPDRIPDRPVQTAHARRRHLLQIPARLTRTSRTWTLRMPARWPWQTDFTTVLDAIRALPART